MVNIYDFITANASYFRQAQFDGQKGIFIDYLCPITEMRSRVWTHKNCLMYIMEGVKGYASLKQYHESQKGQVLFIRKGGYILFQKFDEPYRALIFMFGDDAVKSLLAQYPELLTKQAHTEQAFMEQPELLLLKSSRQVRSIFATSLNYLDKASVRNAVSLDLKFRELMVNLLDEKQPGGFHLYMSWVCNDERAAFIKLMIENSHLNFTVGDLARTAGTSISTFKRMFLRYIGIPPGTWLRQKRIERALALLENSGKTISDIAFELGYSDAAAFSRAFRQATGLSPTNDRFRRIREPEKAGAGKA